MRSRSWVPSSSLVCPKKNSEGQQFPLRMLSGRTQYLNLPPHTFPSRNIRTQQSFFVYNPHPANLPCLQWVQMYQQVGKNAVTPKQQLA